MQLITVLSLLITSVCAATLGRRDDAPLAAKNPPSSQIKVAGVIFAGSGCGAGSGSGSVGADSERVKLKLDKETDLIAASTNEPADRRKNCQINAKIQYPDGWQFAIAGAEYSGRVGLAEGAAGTSKSTYYFSGSTKQVTSAATFTGPYYDSYKRIDSFSDWNTTWSGCGGEGMLNINHEVRIDAGKPAAISVNQLREFDIQWRTC